MCFHHIRGFGSVASHFTPPFYSERCDPRTINAEGCGGTGDPSKHRLRSFTVTEMRFISIIALLASPLAISATRIAWSAVYDNGDQFLSTVACSNGALLTKNTPLQAFKDLPTFPHIGASDAIAAWNSVDCGAHASLNFTS